MKRFAVVLSGNGVFDGSEIHEAVMTMLAINNNKSDNRLEELRRKKSLKKFLMSSIRPIL